MNHLRYRNISRIFSSAQSIFNYNTYQHLERLNQNNQSLDDLAFSVTRNITKSSTGILTCLPSTTFLNLVLGPD